MIKWRFLVDGIRLKHTDLIEIYCVRESHMMYGEAVDDFSKSYRCMMFFILLIERSNIMVMMIVTIKVVCHPDD
ncbi:unnamed protein product [Adineta ricciae]|uniref:Uncharacterized protein n=1 Tax=Adineta ricciae TaxID=249248 RepID=A0A814PEL1_ADIRI|nr:unnamed protein product [Adineta ricciae]